MRVRPGLVVVLSLELSSLPSLLDAVLLVFFPVFLPFFFFGLSSCGIKEVVVTPKETFPLSSALALIL